MGEIDVLILSWHQVYLSGYAGGYIRLQEFLKRAPPKLKYCILDNTPSIYKDISGKSRVIEYNSPFIIRILKKNLFYVWFLFEIFFTIYALYRNGREIIKTRKPKVLYIPIGEFPHTYFPAIFLKIRFPKIKVVIDIFNFGIPERSPSPSYIYKLLRKSSVNMFRGIIMVITGYTQFFFVSRTINYVDYVFTVSSELVDVIKRIYIKNSIDYTPSGVNINKDPLININRKKYLAVYVGRMTVQKGIFNLLQVWTELVKNKPDVKLALVGFADELTKKVISKNIKELRIENNVDCYYGVSEKEKNKILSESELFLHLATFEPLFPVIGILEGFAYGLPAIVYDMDAITSYKTNNKLKGFLHIVENGDIRATLKKILQCSKLQKNTKTKNAQDSIKYAEQFDWDIIAAKEFKVISQFVNNPTYV